ncbi:MAG: glycosyltransferase [Pseudomonadota bacterium]
MSRNNRNHGATPEVSVVIAALDEADNIGPVLDEIEAVFAAGAPFEIVVVDDGSTDATADVVAARAQASPRIRLVRHGRRRGKSAALGTGVAAASGRFVVTMDADGQDDPAEALKLVQALTAAPEPRPMVAGIRRSRRDGAARLVATRLANGLRQALLRDDCVDSGCGLKAFERDLFLRFPMFEGLHRFLPALAKAQGHPVLSIPIEQRPRMSGESKYTNLGRAAVGLFDLLGVAWLVSRTRPERAPQAGVRPAGVGAMTYAALAVFALLMFAPGQASLPPFDRDESRYAQAVVQMLDSGDYVDIHFQDRARHLQPAGIYWLQAAAVTVFSDPDARAIWAHRLPSLLAAIAAVLLTAGIGGRAFGRGPGIAAAVILGASLLLNVEAHMAKIDATLLAVVLGVQGLLLRAYLDRQRLSPGAAALFWLLLGAGIMLKGPLILLFASLTAITLTLWDRSAAWLMRLRPWMVVLTALVVAPWVMAISARTDGAFLQEALGRSLWHKVGSSQQGHVGPAGYHLMMFGLVFWPGAIFALLAAPWVWVKRREPAVRFMVAWIAPAWIVFEIVATKLPHYVLPTYPALAMLAGAALLAGDRPILRGWRRAGMALAGGFVAFVGTLLIVAVGWAAIEYDSARPGLAALACAIAAGLWLWVCWRLARGRRDVATLAAAVAASAALLPATFGGVAPSLQRLWLSRSIDARFDAVRPCPDSVLASAPYAEPSMVFLVGTSTRLTRGEGAADHLLADPKCGVALLAAEEETRFLARLAAAGASARPLASISGRNYADGRELTLTFYRLGTPR